MSIAGRGCAARLFRQSTSLLGLVLIGAPACAWAQDGGPTVSGAGLEDIVVTARRRAESLQTTPLSVSAFNSAALAERNIQTSSDITNFVPNVQFDSTASESGGGASSQISIRGIGQTDYVLTVEPAVGVYLDGVYIGKSMGSLLDTVDIDRIEVLRGPQGTLFGKNTIGGAIQLVSKRPSKALEYYGELTTGSYGRFDAKAAISGPITDAVRVRLSGAYQSRGGFVKRVTPDGEYTGARQGNMNRLSGRLAIEADLAPNLLATLSLDGTRIREESPGQVLVRVDENASFAGAYNAGVPSGVCLASAGASRFTNPYCYNSQWVRPIDTHETTNVGPNRSNTDVIGTGLTLEWNLGGAKLKSITAWRKVKADIAQDITASPYYYNYIAQYIKTQQFSQEVQLLGDAFGSKLHYVLGLYYLHETGKQLFPVELTLVQFLSGGRIRNDSYAAFGQATYDLTSQLSITGGLRYTDETRRFNPAGQVLQGYDYLSVTPVPGFTNLFAGAVGAPGTPLFPAGWYARKSKSVTPMVSINYKLSRDAMIYASYSKGFKGGGFTMRYFPPVVPAAGTDPDDIVSYAGPEKATSYEVGLKSELFDRRLRFNIAGFYTDYKDIQITYNIDPDGAGPIGAFVPVLANAASARIKGIEIESSAAVTDWLRFDGSMGYTDAEYRHFSAQALANYPAAATFKIPNTPKWTYNIGGTATAFDDGKGRLQLRVDYAWRSGQFKEFSNDPALYQKSYGILNSSVTYRTPGKHIEASVGVTNLTDKTYIVSGVSNAGIGYTQATISRPREWFLRLRYSY
ncbi:TonB-dependent receptor [Flavisphingomonas formosensis]|uniref:TonB-dependent receptor n=1 Tax=Flavisphingomonas formosensis TaxID=861534 RepID=UPI0012F8C8E2|nr:TonB-dependent receptor [Sphingomonas formosensis]